MHLGDPLDEVCILAAQGTSKLLPLVVGLFQVQDALDSTLHFMHFVWLNLFVPSNLYRETSFLVLR